MAHATTLMRSRERGRTPVTAFELFFDLVYVFAVTQLSHALLGDLTPLGAGHAVVLLLAVWWAWMYTTWATNWLNPDHLLVRAVLIGVMFASLVMSATIPGAFGDNGLAFAISYVVLQIGRTAVFFVAIWGTTLSRNFQRITAWFCLSGVFWIAGALVDGHARLALWIIALFVDYAGPVARFVTPGLGRSETSDWNISGEHMAERCQLFVIVALGETIVLTGATYSGEDDFTLANSTAFAAAFLATVAMWWIYFHHSAERGSHAIGASADPGRIGRSAYTYMHVPMIAGIITLAVAFELTIAHPGSPATAETVTPMVVGPALFLLGHAGYCWAAFRYLPWSRVVGAAVIVLLALVLPHVTVLTGMLVAMGVLIAVAVWDLLWFLAIRPEGALVEDD